MKNFLRKFSRSYRTGEKGFTLIELLIVIAVLGILAAVIIPNVVGFVKSGHVAAANSELAAVLTAAQAYTAEVSSTAAFTSADLGAYLSATPKGTYHFLSGGILDNVTNLPTSTDTNVKWDKTANGGAGAWVRT